MPRERIHFKRLPRRKTTSLKKSYDTFYRNRKYWIRRDTRLARSQDSQERTIKTSGDRELEIHQENETLEVCVVRMLPLYRKILANQRKKKNKLCDNENELKKQKIRSKKNRWSRKIKINNKSLESENLRKTKQFKLYFSLYCYYTLSY